MKESIRHLKRPEKNAQTNEVSLAIQHLHYVGSYNWLNLVKPSIIVPGSPPEWHDRTLPFSIPPDRGKAFLDQDGYRIPSYPLIPLLKAVDTMEEELGERVDWPNVDVVTDRSSLRKLLRWVMHEPESFRIDMQLAGSRTILLNRWEKKTRVSVKPADKSYGHNFEKHSTVPAHGCEQSSGHHRIVRYDFGCLTMMVRFEVDACIAPEVPKPHSIPNTVRKIAFPELDIIRVGVQVPQSSLIEIKTRARSNCNWTKTYPQLYFSHTPHVYFAKHTDGKVTSIRKRHLDEPGLEKVAERTQVAIRKLPDVLREIQRLAIEHGQEGRLSLVHQNNKLQAFRRTSDVSCLPENMLKRFEA